MGKTSYAIDPFYMSDFSDTDSDDSTMEPIDEQEIYGESGDTFAAFSYSLLQVSCTCSSFQAILRMFSLVVFEILPLKTILGIEVAILIYMTVSAVFL